MMSLTLLLATLGLLVQDSSGEITLTQSPGSQSVVLGQTVSIRYTNKPLDSDDDSLPCDRGLFQLQYLDLEEFLT
ncbi:immunoglobulin lambda-1 light chain-like protein [Lates japonicus]|nr:immunoglobulin lambda-1 light chain-like protein [Lates japonicus]